MKYDTTVSCPTCGADQGEHCYGVTGRPMYGSGHRARKAKAARAWRSRGQGVLPFGELV